VRVCLVERERKCMKDNFAFVSLRKFILFIFLAAEHLSMINILYKKVIEQTRSLLAKSFYSIFETPIIVNLLETLHVVSECKPGNYFNRCLVHMRLPNNTVVLTVCVFSVASFNSWKTQTRNYLKRQIKIHLCYCWNVASQEVL